MSTDTKTVSLCAEYRTQRQCVSVRSCVQHVCARQDARAVCVSPCEGVNAIFHIFSVLCVWLRVCSVSLCRTQGQCMCLRKKGQCYFHIFAVRVLVSCVFLCVCVRACVCDACVPACACGCDSVSLCMHVCLRVSPCVSPCIRGCLRVLMRFSFV